ncbi:MAG: alpha/beta fold hydrolase [Pirellulales bacterium]|nr:alpha/beta fold hydrolase [Thermoguttaceae bacterium]MDD4787858.1 alpha/beta fold hydrolase [Pirellulales bacterium]MDI9444732.1 alpha/beta fold hydrolase [Planctomycetota bacterium]NLY99099.1 alpha/beta fold hydrolase [Pirellulaceae bacterium]
MSGFIWLLLSLLILTVVLHVVARVLRVPVVAESCRRAAWLPTHWREPLEEGKEVRFQTADGVWLSGTYLHRLTESSRGTILYSHEMNGDRWNALPYVEHLRGAGFDVFTFDYRNHGRSESVSGGDPAPEVTHADMADLTAAVRLATRHADMAGRPVGVIGVSKGAAIALRTAAEEPLIRALVLDSIQPARRRDLRSARLFNRSWLPVRRFVRRRDDRVDLARAAQQLRAATLIVHGQDDVDVPLQFIRSIATRIPSECQLWIVPQARHAEAMDVAAAAYRTRIVDFFARTMHTAPLPRDAELPRLAPAKAIPRPLHLASSGTGRNAP